MASTIREAIISTVWDVEGEEQIESAEQSLNAAAADAADVEDKSRQAGDAMEQAGQKGEESFEDAGGALEGINQNLGKIAAGSTAASAALGAATASFVNQSADLETAQTRVTNLADQGGQAFVEQAKSIENMTDNMFSATEVMSSQAQLLRSDTGTTQQVRSLTTAASRLAAATGDDLNEVMEELRDPFEEAEGIIQLVTRGYAEQEDVIRQLDPALVGTGATLASLAERFSKAERRAAIVNAVVQQGRRQQEAAESTMQTFNARWTGLFNVLEKVQRIMGKDVREAFTQILGAMTDWLNTLANTEKGTLRMIGRLTVFGVLLTGILGGVSVLTIGLKGLSAVFAVTQGTVALLSAKLGLAIGIITAGIVAIADLIFLFTTGETRIFNWAKATDRFLIPALQSAVQWVNNLLGIDLVSILESFRNIIFEIVFLWRDFTNFIFDAGVNFVSTLASGISSGASSVINAVKGVASTVRQYLPFSDAKRGPFSQLTEAGKAIPETISVGVEKGEGSLEEKFQTSPAGGGSDSLVPAGGGTGRKEVIRLEISDEATDPRSSDNVQIIAEAVSDIILDKAGIQVQGSF